MSVPMRIVHPHILEAYQIGYDDHCIVLASGSKPDAPKIWLSKSMLAFLEEGGFSEAKTKREMRLKLKDLKTNNVLSQ